MHFALNSFFWWCFQGLRLQLSAPSWQVLNSCFLRLWHVVRAPSHRTVDSQCLHCATGAAPVLSHGHEHVTHCMLSNRLLPLPQTQSYKCGPSAVGQTVLHVMLIHACTEGHFSTCCTSLNDPVSGQCVLIGPTVLVYSSSSPPAVITALMSTLPTESPCQALSHVH